MTAPQQQSTDQSIPIDMQAVVEEMGKDPLSKALLERAQFLTIVRAQDTELRYLRELQAQAEPGGPKDVPSQGGGRVAGS